MGRVRGWSAVVLLGAVAAVLAGCGAGGPSSAAESVVRGVPAEWDGPAPDLLEAQPVAGWLGEDRFGVVTFGSSTCPAVAESFQAVDPGEVAVTFVESPHDPCTADLGATTHVFRLPESVTDRPVTVTLTWASGDGIRLTLP